MAFGDEIDVLLTVEEWEARQQALWGKTISQLVNHIRGIGPPPKSEGYQSISKERLKLLKKGDCDAWIAMCKTVDSEILSRYLRAHAMDTFPDLVKKLGKYKPGRVTQPNSAYWD